MRWARPDRGGGSFVARVARVTTIVAALSAALTAGVSTVVAGRLIRSGMDRRLRGAAVALADEIRVDPAPAEIQRDVDEDARELAYSGLRLAVFRGSRLQAGSASVPPAPAPGCQSAPGLRLCAVPAGDFVVVVAGAEGAAELGRFAQAALLALLITVAVALLTGRRLATRVVGPLTRLAASVDTVSERAPGRAALGPDEGWAEVDALRGTLAQLLTRLDRALAQARRFAADAAHELRTPVATMRAELELLAEDPGDLAAARAAIARVHRTLLAMSALIERLLILALPADEEGNQGQAVAMADLVREATAALPPDRRARVQPALDSDGMVRGDPTLLRAMVDNALDNALKFGAAGAVQIGVNGSGDSVVTWVQDSGPGIPPAERTRVFEPFYRTPEARAGAVRGHGIGLALIAHVAAGHGGRASFTDSAAGARLEISLPAWRARPAGDPASPAAG